MEEVPSPSPTIAQRVQLVVRCLKRQYNWKHANRVLAVQVGKNTDDIWVCNARAPPEGGNTATACAHFQRMIVSHAICKQTSLPRSTMFFSTQTIFGLGRVQLSIGATQRATSQHMHLCTIRLADWWTQHLQPVTTLKSTFTCRGRIDG